MSSSFRGDVDWVGEAEETGHVLRAVFRNPTELVLEIEHNSRIYIVDLKPKTAGSSRWRGTVTRQGGGNGGTAEARVIREVDELILFGEWLENGRSWMFWAELEAETP